MLGCGVNVEEKGQGFAIKQAWITDEMLTKDRTGWLTKLGYDKQLNVHKLAIEDILRNHASKKIAAMHFPTQFIARSTQWYACMH